MPDYENIRLPADSVKEYRRVSDATGVPLLRLIVFALEHFAPRLSVLEEGWKQAQLPSTTARMKP